MMQTRRAVLFATAASPFAVLSVGRAEGLAEIVCPLAAAPATLIPGISNDPGARLLGGKIYRGLMRLGPDGTPQPDLAQSVDRSADELTYVLHLQPGVTWHDSGGFGAADVVFSLARFHRALQPRLGLDRIGVTTPDALTVVLTLPVPDPAFLGRLDCLSLPIVPQHIHDRPGWGLNPQTTKPVGTGPFRVAGWLRLVRFEWFAGRTPSVAAIDCPIMPDVAARMNLTETGGGVLLTGETVGSATIARIRASGRLVVEGDASPTATTRAGLRLNQAAKPLDRPEVNLALAHAVDRAAVLREVWAGLGRVAPPLGVTQAAAEFSPRLATQHLTAAGLRPDDRGVRARLTYLHPPGPPWQSLFPVLRTQLAQVGIVLDAEPVTAAEWAIRVAAGAFQMTGVSLPGPASIEPDGPPTLWLVETAMPVVHDARLHLPTGVLGDFTDVRWEP